MAKVEPSSAPINVAKASAMATNLSTAQLTSPTSVNSISVVNGRRDTNAIRQYMESQNKPIRFYGLVIDQNNNPISGVKVNIEVRHIKVIVAAPWGDECQMIPIEKETDLSGRFEIDGATGDSLTIKSVKKIGFKLSPKTENIYSYSGVANPHHPDSQNPIIIKMWKELSNKEPLVTGSHVFGIDSGKIYTLDLIKGKSVLGEVAGDLRVSITRPSDVKPRDQYLWSFSVEAIAGGLLESDDEFMYLAPKSGYQPKLTMQFDPADSDWKKEVVKQFYICTRNGQIYGRVQVKVYSTYNIHSAIEVNYAINPNGSPNLQP